MHYVVSKKKKKRRYINKLASDLTGSSYAYVKVLDKKNKRNKNTVYDYIILCNAAEQ